MKKSKKNKHAHFSKWLKKTRLHKGLSQDAVCAALSLSKPSYSRWETGVGLPHADRLLALSVWGKTEAKALLKLLAAA